MRLFHVSEEENIEIFNPRLPYREDLDKTKGLVWAINEECLPNFLTPRNCPRVTYHCSDKTTEEDKEKYLSSKTTKHVVVVEHKWYEIIKNTTLYIYEFDTKNFYLQDRCAGYYVSENIEKPINKIVIDDLLGELIKRNVEIRIVDNLWDIWGKIKESSFDWSMCRMGFAEPNNK